MPSNPKTNNFQLLTGLFGKDGDIYKLSVADLSLLYRSRLHDITSPLKAARYIFESKELSEGFKDWKYWNFRHISDSDRYSPKNSDMICYWDEVEMAINRLKEQEYIDSRARVSKETLHKYLK